MPGVVKKDTERERIHAGHASQPSIRIVMPGLKMNLNAIQEKNERIVQISFCLRNPLSHLEKKL